MNHFILGIGGLIFEAELLRLRLDEDWLRSASLIQHVLATGAPDATGPFYKYNVGCWAVRVADMQGEKGKT